MQDWHRDTLESHVAIHRIQGLRDEAVDADRELWRRSWIQSG
jgi:hypothetical protein